MAKVTMIEAINRAHAWEMAHDSTVVVLGEDIGINGGVFRATAGLQEKFGKERVQDTPLAEGMIAGMSIGLAAQGLRPVAEIQFMGFIYPAMDQIANHMARMRHRTRGRITLPLVMRMPHGGGIHAPEHHSESLEAMLPKDHLWPIDEVWNYHAGGGEFKNIKVFTDALESRYGKANNVEDFADEGHLASFHREGEILDELLARG